MNASGRLAGRYSLHIVASAIESTPPLIARPTFYKLSHHSHDLIPFRREMFRTIFTRSFNPYFQRSLQELIFRNELSGLSKSQASPKHSLDKIEMS